MDSEEKAKKDILLKGRVNYLAWATRLELMLALDDVAKRNDNDNIVVAGETELEKKTNEKKAKRYVVQNLSDSVMHSINPNDSFEDLLANLNAAYGYANMDPSVVHQKLRTISFHPNKDPGIMLNQINLWTAELDSAGGEISEAQLVQLMIDGLSGDTFKDNFWFNCRGQMIQTGLKTYSFATAGRFITRFWYAYKPVRATETSNQATYEKRLCQMCKKSNRTRIMKTHNTADCRFLEETALSTKLERNKESSTYSSSYCTDLFHDSGTSRTMINYKPANQTQTNTKIPVFTAGKHQPPEIGISKGTIKVGDLNVEAIEVPTFSKNLLSATQLSIEQGCEQIIEPWTAKLTIKKDNKIVATGSFDEETKLIKIDMTNQERTFQATTNEDWITVHRKLGHAGKGMIAKTLKASKGIKLQNRFSVLDCEDCSTTKAKRKSVKKHVTRPKELLEIIETDIQGPFPITANDGTNYNLKFIDSKSGWLYYTTVTDCTANTVLDHFLKYKVRLEKQTGKLVKRVRTDGGVEYMKEFMAHLSAEGLIKETGIPYTKHHPGKAERTHQTILRNGRANLKQSKLPEQMYNEAQRYSAYIFNRTVHGTDIKTPYEHIFNRLPDLTKLQPFGCVCYAFISPLSVSKLDDNGIRCRLLGFGDDFDSEETNGYRLLKENDGTIFYSDSVRFSDKPLFERLDDSFYSTHPDMIGKDPTFHLIESESVSDEESNEEYWDAEEALSEEESVHLIENLLNETWWQSNTGNPLNEIYRAYKATTDGTPMTYNDAMLSEEAELWKAAMKIEYDALKANNTFKVIKSDPKDIAIKSKWVFKRKLNPDGSVARYKARLVAKGFLQKHGKDFFETFAPVAKSKSIRLLLAIAGSRGQMVYHDDATSAFLNGILKERVVLEPPQGYQVQHENPAVSTTEFRWLLLKALYGLKQAPREWNEVLHNFLIEQGLNQSKRDPCIYYKGAGKDQILIGVYVDDLLSTGGNLEEVQRIRNAFKTRFKCSDGEELNWCLGMEVNQTEMGIYISQNSYIKQKLDEFKDWVEPKVQRKLPLVANFQELLITAENSTEIEEHFPYRQIVGSLMYASTLTRPDISTAVGVVCRFLENPKKIHCDMVRQILYYLRGTSHYSLNYPRGNKEEIQGYVDASWANCEDYTSIYGYGFLFGNSIVSWCSKKQKTVALSSTEAEYMTITHGSQEALWFLELLNELGIYQEIVTLHEDNEASIKMSNNPQEYKRTRHIQVRYHFIRNLIQEKKIRLQHCSTNDQLADLFTKGISSVKLQDLLPRIGISMISQQGRELKYAETTI